MLSSGGGAVMNSLWGGGNITDRVIERGSGLGKGGFKARHSK